MKKIIITILTLSTIALHSQSYKRTDLKVNDSTLNVDATNNRVGIGTSSPQDKLHIAGTTQMEFSAGTKYKFDLRGDGVMNLYNLTSGQSSGLEFYSQDGDGTDFVSFTIFGNQDFTSTGTLTNYSRLINIFYPGTGYVVGTNASGVAKSKLYFNTTGLTNPNLVIDTLGKVGIGTSSPSYPLEMGSGAHVTTGGTWTNASDIKLKTNINYIYPYGLSEVLNLKPVVFDYINGEKNTLGFIAQDVFEYIPEAISSTIDDNGNETMGLKMVSITSTLTKAIQEQQAIIESQSTEIEQLKSQIQLILSEIEQIKNN